MGRPRKRRREGEVEVVGDGSAMGGVGGVEVVEFGEVMNGDLARVDEFGCAPLVDGLE